MELTVDKFLSEKAMKFPVKASILNSRDLGALCIANSVSAFSRGSTRSEPVPCRRAEELVLIIVATGVVIFSLGVDIVSWIGGSGRFCRYVDMAWVLPLGHCLS
jgi:hypothetical protein